MALGTGWDKLSIETPELVAIDLPVAGLGSRFVALLVDYVIWGAATGLLVFVMVTVDPSLSHFGSLGHKWATVLGIFLPFVWYWGYFTFFEAFWGGRTPGKRVAKIRVIQRSGRGIGLFESMTRNLLRVVDQFPFIYVVGVISMFMTRQHQRLGDLAAGTIVVHEREALVESNSIGNGRTFTASYFATTAEPGMRADVRPRFEISAGALQHLGVADLEVLEGFFARRLEFSMETRAALAERIAEAIRSKSGLEALAGMSTESFLEETARRLRDLERAG